MDFWRLLKSNGLKVENKIVDSECEEYSGCSFTLGTFQVKFRKAKITPKKVGQFVTLWKRNVENQTVPFNETDVFDFYIILTEEITDSGFFVFPKEILSEKNILSTVNKEGKRGFRVYPLWVNGTNKQASKTQVWQTKHFLKFDETDKLKSIFRES